MCVGAERSSSGDYKLEDEELAGLPPGGLTMSWDLGETDEYQWRIVINYGDVREGPLCSGGRLSAGDDDYS